MLLINTREKRIISDDECKRYYATQKPYGQWLDQNLVKLKDLPVPNKRVPVHDQVLRDKLYKAFGYTYEDIQDTILPMARDSKESIQSMGIDITLAVLSERHQSLFNCFKQQFAQVTNPPIDAIREETVTDTHVFVGSDGNLLTEQASNCNVLEIDNPILTSVDLMKIKAIKRPGFKVETLSLLYYKNTSLEKALDRLFLAADRAYRQGANILILSDRGVDENHLYNPNTIIALREATQSGSYERFKEFTKMIDTVNEGNVPHALRGLLELNTAGVTPIPIEQVEPASEIVKRFKTGAM